jgi:hypothetical protein
MGVLHLRQLVVPGGFDSWHWGQTTAVFSDEYFTNLSVSDPKLKSYGFYPVATPSSV